MQSSGLPANSWWHSASTMRRLARNATLVAVASLTIAFAMWPYSLLVAVPGFVVGTAAVVIGLFSWFRAEHLDALPPRDEQE